MVDAMSCADPRATQIDREPNYSANYLSRWQTFDGCDVRVDFVMTRSGGCFDGVDDVLMGWPLGGTNSHHNNRIFIRDPQGMTSHQAAAGFDPEALLPTAARDTGLRQDGVEMWMVPNKDDFIWLVGQTTERWPQERVRFGCG